MPLDASDQNQLTVLLILATLLFIIASALPQKVGTIALLLLVPFQAIEFKFGTSSVVLAYVVFIAMILRKEAVRLPMLPHFLFLLLWYLVSMGFMHPSTYVQHGVYIFSLVSAFLVFWLSYDLANRVEKVSSVVGVFVVINALVAIYCAIQIWMGPGERLVLFGIQDMAMTRVRADGRLTGPFESAEITAQYLVLMEFLIIHQYWHSSSSWMKRGLVLLATLNFGFLIATGSRGEFLVLVGGLGIYFWLFRQRLGIRRALGLAVGAAFALTLMALIAINFTEFGRLFERLEETEISEEGIPDTRQGLWLPTLEEIAKSPIIGHGPRMAFYLESRGVRYKHHDPVRYPHSLYLFLLYTVGVPGLILFMLMLLTILFRCWRAMSMPNAPPYYADLARTGAIVLLLFMIDGIKIDAMRHALADYWHLFFGLCGVFVAACDRCQIQSGLAESNRLGLADDGRSFQPVRRR